MASDVYFRHRTIEYNSSLRNWQLFQFFSSSSSSLFLSFLFFKGNCQIQQFLSCWTLPARVSTHYLIFFVLFSKSFCFIFFLYFHSQFSVKKKRKKEANGTSPETASIVIKRKKKLKNKTKICCSSSVRQSDFNSCPWFRLCQFWGILEGRRCFPSRG